MFFFFNLVAIIAGWFAPYLFWLPFPLLSSLWESGKQNNSFPGLPWRQGKTCDPVLSDETQVWAQEGGRAVNGEALVFLRKGNGCGCPALPLHPIQSVDLGSNSHFIARRKHTEKTSVGTGGQRVCESLTTPWSHRASPGPAIWVLILHRSNVCKPKLFTCSACHQTHP